MKKAFWVVMFCLIVSSTAKAECAWVLWTKTETSLPNRGLQVRWELINAFPKYEYCMEALKISYQTYKKAWLGSEIDNKEKANDEKFILFPFSGYKVGFHCLPDTIDPRKWGRDYGQ